MVVMMVADSYDVAIDVRNLVSYRAIKRVSNDFSSVIKGYHEASVPEPCNRHELIILS